MDIWDTWHNKSMAYVVFIVSDWRKICDVITWHDCAIILMIAQNIFNPIAESIALLHQSVELLAPVWYKYRFRQVIFRAILIIDGYSIKFLLITLRWLSLDPTGDKSTLVQVMAWYSQAPITWSNVDPAMCRHMLAQGHNEIAHKIMLTKP